MEISDIPNNIFKTVQRVNVSDLTQEVRNSRDQPEGHTAHRGSERNPLRS